MTVGDLTVPLIPRSVLFSEPHRLYPALSPGGNRIAYVAPSDGVANVWVQRLGEADAHPVTHDRVRGVRSFGWAHDDRHILYHRDSDGNEQTHVYAVDVAQGTERDLTPVDGVQARLIGAVPGRPHVVLIGLNLRAPALHDIYEVDLRTGDRKLVMVNPGFAGWVHDADLRIVAGSRWRPDGGMEIMARDGETRSWRPVHTVEPENATNTRVVAVSRDGRALILLSSADSETTSLRRVDIADGRTEVLYVDPAYDVVGAGLHPVSGQPDLAVVHRERRHLEPLDERSAQRLAWLHGELQGDVVLVDRSADDGRWLVLDCITDGPSVYHLFDFHRTEHRVLFAHQPALADYVMSATEPFTFAARDGLTVHGYLTFPPSRERRALPTVLAVHGGPWARDGWGSGDDAQWLANRGYLCVQVNFRGSTGYGRSFTAAGDGEWGGRMQDDLTDAVAWLVERGWTDPSRVAVYGRSYGGYAALAGVALTPALYRCAVAVSAPTDLRTFVRAAMAATPLLAPRIRRGVGDPERDADRLWDRSPLARVSQVRAPILLAHGANDPRVPLSEADQFAAALRRRGVPHRYLVFPDEGHGFVRRDNRMAFYAAVEEFLAEHLGGRSEQ